MSRLPVFWSAACQRCGYSEQQPQESNLGVRLLYVVSIGTVALRELIIRFVALKKMIIFAVELCKKTFYLEDILWEKGIFYSKGSEFYFWRS